MSGVFEVREQQSQVRAMSMTKRRGLLSSKEQAGWPESEGGD